MKKSIKYGILIFAAVAGLGLYGAQAGSARNGYDKQKVVYQVNDIAMAADALADVERHLNALGDGNAEIIVVAHRSGAYMLADGAMNRKQKKAAGTKGFNDTISALANRGVKFQIGAFTIRADKIDKNLINEHAEIVPSGIAHVAHLQQKGYLYIKP